MLRQARHKRDGVVHCLLCHPATPATAINGIAATCARDGDRLVVAYRIGGDIQRLAVEQAAAERTDGLWRHSCFEAFVAGAGTAYLEFNFAPSGAWAVYAFEDYRSGLRDADAAPVIGWRDGVLTAEVPVPIADEWRLNLSAVIEEADGTKSYWALAHTDGPPDFHHPDCFTLRLPAVG